ncbi:MAG: hypothetical protein ABJC13_21055 [Acidobacteriota bacterium]
MFERFQRSRIGLFTALAVFLAIPVLGPALCECADKASASTVSETGCHGHEAREHGESHDKIPASAAHCGMACHTAAEVQVTVQAEGTIATLDDLVETMPGPLAPPAFDIDHIPLA